jgi:hypothetical protein
MPADCDSKRSVHGYLLFYNFPGLIKIINENYSGFILRNKLSPCQTKAIPVRTVEQDETF